VTEDARYDEDALNAQLAEARGRIDKLSSELGFVESELASMETERQQFSLLQDVCVGLEKLNELGADDLFWKGRLDVHDGVHHVRQVREKVDEFGRHFDQVESKRVSIVEKIKEEQNEVDFIADDLFELKRREEQKKLEWVIERDISDLPPRLPEMPWSHVGEDDRRLRKSLASSLLLSLLFAFVMGLITVPLPDRSKPIEVPERLTRLIEERKPVVQPPPVPIEKEEEKLAEEETKPEETEVAEKKPEPRAEPVNREAVEKKGVLAFRDNFAALAENVSEAETLLGKRARVDRSGGDMNQRIERNMVATATGGTSSGINVAALSRNVVGGGGGSIEGVKVTQATSAIGELTGPERPLSTGPGAARTDEEIQIVFDRHKAALYRLYNRALRQNPTLRGQIVLKLTIEPGGSVSLCQISSSDMKAPELAQQVVDRVKAFDFGAKEGVGPVTILYPIDFLPAT